MARDAHGFANFKAIIESRKLGALPTSFFDVGANVGQTVAEILQHFEPREIHAFEPVPAAFRALEDAFGGRPNIYLSNVALGAANGELRMLVSGTSTGNSVIKDSEAANTMAVPVMLGDDYVEHNRVERIGYLKIDTEGHDLEVLRGLNRTLSAHAIDYVEVEAGLSVDNARHVPFEDLKSYLEGLGYRLLQIKSLVTEQHFSGLANLRRCNLVFASQTLLNNMRTEPKRLEILRQRRAAALAG